MTTTAPAPDQAPPDDDPGHARAKRRRRPNWVYVPLTVGLLVLVGPFVWMLLGSVKPPEELRQVPPTWFPQTWTLDNYADLFARLDFLQYFTNSVVVAVAVTAGNLVLSSMLGYALSKIDFPGRRALFLLVMGTLMVPVMVTFVPLFVLVSNLGLVNTYPGLILPLLTMAAPFGVFLMRQFIAGLPDELIEAARVDGASEFRIYARIVLPLSRPALATLGILTFLAAWNNFLWPLVAAQSEDMYTLPVAVALISVGPHQTDYGLLLAGAVVVIMPVLLVFVLLQRHLVQGIATTGLK